MYYSYVYVYVYLIVCYYLSYHLKRHYQDYDLTKHGLIRGVMILFVLEIDY